MLKNLSLVILSLFVVQGNCISDEIKGVIGDTDIVYKAERIESRESAAFRFSEKAKYLCITEIYPDNAIQPLYKSDVLIDSKVVSRRSNKGAGFGKVSYFVEIPSSVESYEAVIKNTGREDIFISGLRSVKQSDLSAIRKKDSFGLFGLLLSYHGEAKESEWIEKLASGLPEHEGIYRGFSSEIPYAAWDDDVIKSLINRHIGYAEKYGLVYFPSLVSWWAATPLNVADGEGGRFGNIKYQQICWSPDSTGNEKPEFKELMGERWDRRYDLSIPNEWSNVPWLTMNSPVLNSYRHKRLDIGIRNLLKLTQTADIKLHGIYLENEPRYWDTACEAGNYKRDWNECWADFNPLVIADAKKDGVNIDPADGLDSAERLWLHRNVARYNQNTVDAAADTLKSLKMADEVDLYTHTLQLSGFPGDAISHTMSEWAYVKGANTGLEGMWVKITDFDRVLEWGKWANLNREENDGRSIEEHLWDLRCSYACGAVLYNSYNWQAIAENVVFNYMNDFVKGLPSTELAEPDIQIENSRRLSFRLNSNLQAVNQVKLVIESNKGFASEFVATVKNKDLETAGFAAKAVRIKKGMNNVTLNFMNPISFPLDERAELTISSSDGIDMKDLHIKKASFWFDLRKARDMSLFIIKNAKKQ